MRKQTSTKVERILQVQFGNRHWERVRLDPFGVWINYLNEGLIAEVLDEVQRERRLFPGEYDRKYRVLETITNTYELEEKP